MATRTPRDWGVDTGLFLVAAACCAVVAVDGVATHVEPRTLTVDVVLGAIGCLGLWLRRRWPVGLAIVVAAFSTASESAGVVALIALFTVAVHRRPSITVAVAAWFGACSVLSPFVRPDVRVPAGIQVVLAALVVALLLGWGMYVRVRRQSLVERARQARQEQELRVSQARQLERERIAREMHDVLAHRISLLSLHAGALELRSDLAPEIVRAMGVIRASAHDALEDLRELIGVLRSSAGDDAVPDPPQPSLDDLPTLVEETRRAGTPVRFDCHIDGGAAVPAALGRAVYRIVQEGLTNARKHGAGAVSVEVGVTDDREGVTVEVRNGVPVGSSAPAIPGTGTGLIGLAERVSLLGGALEHGSTSEGEFQLRVRLPWPS